MQTTIKHNVLSALEEDLNGLSADVGDITASLIQQDTDVKAAIITREDCILCGSQWAQEAFYQVNPSLQISWLKKDGEACQANDVLCEISGSAKAILTAERTALNFLQTLSATATVTRKYVDALQGSGITLLDTRKTIPGLRIAQKYAVTCGGGQNHRIGLFDAYLIKENHISACGTIAAAVSQAKQMHPGKPVEVEAENLDELQQAIDAGADIVMLDNFDKEQLRQGVELNKKRVKLEVSGNITAYRLEELYASGIDFISSGALTKHIQAIDLSLRII
ncbi:carboxylating nicotinate-nucleotide diphosphorylase [Aliiglaciecola sp. LCG003]|uniref:carboxylating nicotinate-nucleotide diphosphorylase n=1 Tax=Aliiglaciecola sp. LCG003 TaxID=3053655 RepID=UPI0025744561|nr:carboxylating nicotinate-nucleotide diphosphorylase [Aliiglaciecola sp. LCG003]WJG10202.1 carboxylating nicotinate-nucleotide diphosphorylase [Aliiglaciecola sp. LCG003]